jgi:hypothetical protein
MPSAWLEFYKTSFVCVAVVHEKIWSEVPIKKTFVAGQQYTSATAEVRLNQLQRIWINTIRRE